MGHLLEAYEPSIGLWDLFLQEKTLASLRWPAVGPKLSLFRLYVLMGPLSAEWHLVNLRRPSTSLRTIHRPELAL